MRYILKWLIVAGVILLLPTFITGIRVEGVYTALIVALVLALLNITIKPILIVLTLPVTILTLGLFLFVLNALMLQIAASIVKGFYVDGFIPAFIAALVISVVGFIIEKLAKN